MVIKNLKLLFICKPPESLCLFSPIFLFCILRNKFNFEDIYKKGILDLNYFGGTLKWGVSLCIHRFLDLT